MGKKSCSLCQIITTLFALPCFLISTLDPNVWAITFRVGPHEMERLRLPLFYMKHAFEVGFRPRIL
jgi:hypothetical protein